MNLINLTKYLSNIYHPMIDLVSLRFTVSLKKFSEEKFEAIIVIGIISSIV